MTEPVIAGRIPTKIDLKAGQTYAWCACGKSNNQPFCDGAHQGSSFAPTVFKQEADQTAYICMCKKTSKAPFCDGAHTKLPA